MAIINKEKFLNLDKISIYDRKIFDYIWDNIENSKLSVRNIAKTFFTSTSSIMRMSKKLGYSGFSEMIFSLKELKKLESKNVTNMEFSSEYSFHIKDISKIKTFLELLKNGRIFIYGEGFSEIVSLYIYKKLTVIGIDSFLWHGIDFKVLKNNRNNYQMAIIISKSGKTKYCVELCEYLKNLNIPVISFTGDKFSNLASKSDIPFTFKDSHKLDDDVFHPNPFFGNCIIGFEELIQLFFLENRTDIDLNKKNPINF